MEHDLRDMETEALLKLAQSSPQSFQDMLTDKQALPETQTLPAYLEELMERRNVTITQLIKNSLLSKTYVYQILSAERSPSRDMLVRIGFALSLSLEEMQRLLRTAQTAALYPKIRRDAAIICCLAQEMSIGQTSEFLTQIQERPLL